MPNDYTSMAIALAMAAQAVAPEANAKHLYRYGTAGAVFASLISLYLLRWLDFTSLRLTWLLSGAVLCTYALRTTRGYVASSAVAVLDTAGGWIALALSGVTWPSIAAGATAGVMLPLAVGPWPPRLQTAVRVVAVIGIGSVGLKSLIQALCGGTTWPLALFAIPWLILWDWRFGRAATTRLPKQ